MRKYIMQAHLIAICGTRADVISTDDLPDVDYIERKPVKLRPDCKKPAFLLERDSKRVHKRK